MVLLPRHPKAKKPAAAWKKPRKERGTVGAGRARKALQKRLDAEKAAANKPASQPSASRDEKRRGKSASAGAEQRTDRQGRRERGPETTTGANGAKPKRDASDARGAKGAKNAERPARDGNRARSDKANERRSFDASAKPQVAAKTSSAKPPAAKKTKTVGKPKAHGKPVQPQQRQRRKKPVPVPELSGVTRSGTVALVGRPNVGKSTLLNAALGQKLAIVSRTAQTTRNTLLGVVHKVLENGDHAELALLDTPGLHEGKTALNRRMNGAAQAAAANADVVVFITDVPPNPSGVARPHRQDLELIRAIGPRSRTLLVINKVDTLKDKAWLLGLIEALSHVRQFDAVIPLSALMADGVDRVLQEAGERLAEGPHVYGEDDMTDRPMRFFAAEYVREQVLERAREEVPHATAVSIDVFEERGGRTYITATVHVERAGQKKILIGEGGSMLRAIGENARMRIAELLGTPVHLELFVRETPSWRDNPNLLGELGYEDTKPERTGGRAPRAAPKMPLSKERDS